MRAKQGTHNTALSCEARLNKDGARSAPSKGPARFVSCSALFDSATNVILYSQFGSPSGSYPENDGFEEWFIGKGGITGGPGDIDIAALTPAEGFKITGVSFEQFESTSVSDAGDVNGDGLDDIIVNGAFVVYGKQGKPVEWTLGTYRADRYRATYRTGAATPPATEPT